MKSPDDQMRALAEQFGATTGKLNRQQTEMEQRLTAALDAAVQLLIDLEVRIADLEKQRQLAQPPPRPRLITDADAA